MYNAHKPNADELPSSAQLLKSTFIALGVAAAILVTAILPAEYGIDPTGVGKVLGLTEMGEIKTQLAEEADADQLAALSPPTESATPAVTKQAQAVPVAASSLKPDDMSAQTAVEPVAAAPLEKETRVVKTPQAKTPAPTPSPLKSNEVSFTLAPGQGAEIKLEMLKGKTVAFHWTGNGGKVNYDTHGDPYNAPRGFYHGYGKGRFTLEDQGELKAAFDGYHGWFWRNRTKEDITLTLRVEGNYIAFKRVL